MRTTLCDKLGIEIPIVQAPVQAPIGDASGPRLAAAVCNAGGLGSIPLFRADPATVRARVRELKGLTARPFVVNLSLQVPEEERVDACLEETVPVISFFWGEAGGLVTRAHAGGALVMQTVSSAEQARAAVGNGVDIVVAQGWEAGGHVRGTIATMALVPAVVDAAGGVPVVAAGGIADGRGMAAALALGASGVWIGTRFLASAECDVHPHYRQRLLAAVASDTVYLEDLFDVGWRNAPHRALRNTTFAEWDASGRPRSGERPGEGDIVGTSLSRGQVARYSDIPPRTDTEGDIEAMAMWAGQGVGLVQRVQPAAETVREIDREASAILKRLATTPG